jgi:hypothetical protein
VRKVSAAGQLTTGVVGVVGSGSGGVSGGTTIVVLGDGGEPGTVVLVVVVCSVKVWSAPGSPTVVELAEIGVNAFGG